METQENTAIQENILEKRIKKSNLKAKDIFDYEYLMQKAEGLLPITI